MWFIKNCCFFERIGEVDNEKDGIQHPHVKAGNGIECDRGFFIDSLRSLP